MSLTKDLKKQLLSYLHLAQHDPHVNPVKLLAYYVSRQIGQNAISLEDIDQALCTLNRSALQRRGQRLRARAGVDHIGEHQAQLKQLILDKTTAGFNAFKSWCETPAIGLVTTAHPTFALTKSARDTLLKSALKRPLGKTLHSGALIRQAPPRLNDEHDEAMACIAHMHGAIDNLNEIIMTVAREKFPSKWHKITPQLVSVASWVGYDLDGRNDISWIDTVRFKLQEKVEQLEQYKHMLDRCTMLAGSDVPPALTRLDEELAGARAIAASELEAFHQDLNDKKSLIAAANLLTAPNPKRWVDGSCALNLVNLAITQSSDHNLIGALTIMRAQLARCGMGTAAIHLRVNAQQVLYALSGHISVSAEDRLDARTLLARLETFADTISPINTNFADLDAETSTVNRQMILAAGILKHIDRDTPIRFLIAECDQAAIVVGALGLARYYGVDHKLDISPLFETPNALRNGGRVIAQLLELEPYRAYVSQRKQISIQTGFSDAGRFMGQVPAVLAVERLQSHVADAVAQSGLKSCRVTIFNTHGESIGRGGHPGTLTDRMNYILSPWILAKFAKRRIRLTHEFSFQGGDGYLWFAAPELASASLLQLICARFQNTQASLTDPFYRDADFIWDFYNEVITQQDSLYNDTDYRYLLSGFARNFLIPSGSRPEIRQASGPMTQSSFTPRRIRAIPHNALLQQLAVPTNVLFGLGRAMRIDPDRFTRIGAQSARATTLLSLIETAWQRTNMQVLTAYGDLQDPNFWIARAMTTQGESLDWRFRVVAHTLYQRNAYARTRQLCYRLREDGQLQRAIMRRINRNISLGLTTTATQAEVEQALLQALRLSVVMQAQISASELPVNAPPGATRAEIMEKICSFDIANVIDTLNSAYPPSQEDRDWGRALEEPGTPREDANRISMRTLRTLGQCEKLIQLASQGLTHQFDAYG